MSVAQKFFFAHVYKIIGRTDHTGCFANYGVDGAFFVMADSGADELKGLCRQSTIFLGMERIFAFSGTVRIASLAVVERARSAPYRCDTLRQTAGSSSALPAARAGNRRG
ncbi:MAG: hypothetical protein R3E79_00455 [Caldilineaceae bacterium]